MPLLEIFVTGDHGFDMTGDGLTHGSHVHMGNHEHQHGEGCAGMHQGDGLQRQGAVQHRRPIIIEQVQQAGSSDNR